MIIPISDNNNFKSYSITYNPKYPSFINVNKKYNRHYQIHTWQLYTKEILDINQIQETFKRLPYLSNKITHTFIKDYEIKLCSITTYPIPIVELL